MSSDAFGKIQDIEPKDMELLAFCELRSRLQKVADVECRTGSQCMLEKNSHCGFWERLDLNYSEYEIDKGVAEADTAESKRKRLKDNYRMMATVSSHAGWK